MSKSMRIHAILLLMLAPATLAAASTVYVPPLDPLQDGFQGYNPYPKPEAPLYAMYAELYGEDYGSSRLLTEARLVEGWELFSPEQGIESISFQAVFRDAYFTQNFGYYEETSSGLEYTLLFSVEGIDPYVPNPASADLRPEGITASLDLENTVGFYLNATLPDGTETPWGAFYTESELNQYYDPGATDPVYAGGSLSNWPNMYGEVHFLILSTPDPDVFLLAMDDLPYGHLSSHTDYNDFLVEMRIQRVVPEPATMMLMAMGVAGIFTRRLVRKAARS